MAVLQAPVEFSFKSTDDLAVGRLPPTAFVLPIPLSICPTNRPPNEGRAMPRALVSAKPATAP
jgi:hypothetical protein